MILAGVFKTPDLMLADTEARQLAEAAANVSRHYNVQATQKTLDWVNLGTVLVLTYGTRIMAAGKRKADARRAAVAATAGDGGMVYPFPGQPNAGQQ